MAGHVELRGCAFLVTVGKSRRKTVDGAVLAVATLAGLTQARLQML